MFVISDNLDTATGLRLAGVEGVVVREKEEFNTTFKKALSDKELGVLLITEQLGEEFKSLISEAKIDYRTPIIVEIPDRHGSKRSPDFITSYVRDAIGVKI